jgi:hypothetical protein
VFPSDVGQGVCDGWCVQAMRGLHPIGRHGNGNQGSLDDLSSISIDHLSTACL